MIEKIGTVAIVGVGLIGRAWANVFARAGWQVHLWDSNPAQLNAATALISRSLHDLEAQGLVSQADIACKNLHVASSLQFALQGADYVQESGPENLEAKRSIFSELDRAAAPTCILASSTSAIVASKFTEDLKGRSRCLVAHPVNPPHLVPLVELCGARWTTPETISQARSIMKAIGQVPIEVKREIDGFVLNRLQVALLTEAFRLVQEGIVSPEDLDHTLADGLGLRWAFMGPFETIELNAPNGIADYCERYVPWFRRYMADLPSASVWDDDKWKAVSDAYGPAPSKEQVAEKSIWRDKRLAALIRHKRLGEQWNDS